VLVINFAALGKLQYNTAVTQDGGGGEERKNRGRKKEVKK
jgi:hypothetical protein